MFNSHGCLTCVVLLVLANSALAGTITFQDGTSGDGVGSTYRSIGVSSPNLRFHDSTLSGNVPFPFEDDMGAVVDFGVLDSSTGYLRFDDAVDFVRISGFGQAAFDLDGATPYSFTLTAFDADASVVATAVQYFGFDVRAGTDGYYPIGILDLRIEATGSISSLSIVCDRKFGIDTIEFGPDIAVAAVPLPPAATMALAMLGGFIATRRLTRGRRPRAVTC